MKTASSGLEQGFAAFEASVRSLLQLLDEGGAPLERIDAARQGCQASLTAMLGELDVDRLSAAEREGAARHLERLSSLSAVVRGRVEAECASLVELKERVRGEQSLLRALDHRSEARGGSCDLSG